METTETNMPANLQIQDSTAIYLKETARWARFLAILGFIFCALIIIMAFFIGAIFSRVSEHLPMVGTGSTKIFLSFIYVIMAIIYFFPCLYLYRFATKMLQGLADNNQEMLDTSFSNLKASIKYVGILTIIVLALYAFALICVVISMAIL